MSALCSLAYVSSATRRLSDAELEALLQGARRFNAAAGVSGALLYHDGSFFQYLEGPHTAIAAAYQRVCASPLHSGIVELLHAPVAHRHFQAWHMGFSQASESLLLTLSQAHWDGARRHSRPLGNDGVQLLLNFWQRIRSDA